MKSVFIIARLPESLLKKIQFMPISFFEISEKIIDDENASLIIEQLKKLKDL